jgi:ACS family hexuronate transporter-like MFS transporter
VTPPISTGRAWAVALIATFTMAISYLDRQVLAALGPYVTESLRLSEEEYGWLQSAFSLAYLVASPLAGRWLDRAGIRTGMLFAVVAWTLVSAGHAFMASFGMLFALRIALGVAESPSYPGGAGAISRTMPAAGRARAFGVLLSGSSLGAMIAPPLATGIASVTDWRFAFGGVALVGLSWVPLWLLATSHAGVRAALAATPAEERARTSLWAIAKHPAVLRAAALVLAGSPVFAFVLLWGSKLLVAAFAIPKERVGVYLWMPPLLYDLGAIAFGDLASRFARRHPDGRPPRLLVTCALALMLTLGVVPLAPDPWTAVALAGVGLFGGGGVFAILTADMIARVGARNAASAGGITAAAQSIAYVVANPLIGRGVDAFGGYVEVCLLLAAWVVPGAIVWLVWRPPPVVGDV